MGCGRGVELQWEDDGLLDMKESILDYGSVDSLPAILAGMLPLF